MQSPEPDDWLATLEVRRNALDMLHARGHEALSDVEKLLGWERRVGMTIDQLAQRLGISKDQLRYTLFRKERQQKAKENRLAAKEAKRVKYYRYGSNELGFTIALPRNWRVLTETREPYNAAQELLAILDDHAESVEESYQRLLVQEQAKAVAFPIFERAYNRDRQHAYRLFFWKLLCIPSDEEIKALSLRELSAAEAYGRLMEDPRTFLVDLQDFKRDYDENAVRKRAAAEQHAYLSSSIIGLFQASPPDEENDDEILVEVSKLRLSRALTALEIYELDKQPPEVVPWGNRPSKGMVVDGLAGVVYYYVFDTGDATAEQPAFFNVYLAEKDEAWILSCSCKYGDFYFKTFTKNKPVFKQIIRSFRRHYA